jgi:hypothetical protein
MATIRELERGMWLPESMPDDLRFEVEMLCHLLSRGVADLVMSLSMFEDAYVAHTPNRPEERRRNAARRRKRQAELEAEHGVTSEHPDCFEEHDALRERIRRAALREEWQEKGGPEEYRHRVVFIHARSFVTTLAQIQRSVMALCRYDFEPEVAAKLTKACNNFAAALPGLKQVRDSAEHGEDRVRGQAYREKIAIQTVSNSFMQGELMVVEALSNRHFGCTVADGTYAEVEVSDATTEIAQVAVQAVYDALPWRPGPRECIPAF